MTMKFTQGATGHGRLAGVAAAACPALSLSARGRNDDVVEAQPPAPPAAAAPVGVNTPATVTMPTAVKDSGLTRAMP
jgi:hypothetical protein